MSVDFESDFNVITGETGAGKSLIIKSLGLLSGQSASDTIIYPKAEFALLKLHLLCLLILIFVNI